MIGFVSETWRRLFGSLPLRAKLVVPVLRDRPFVVYIMHVG